MKSRAARGKSTTVRVSKIAYLRIAGLQYGRKSGNLDSFGDLTDLHLEIHFDGLIDIHVESFGRCLLKTPRFRRHPVTSHSNGRKRIAAGFIAQRRLRSAFVDLLQGNGHARNDSTRCIQDSPGYARRHLAVHVWSCRNQQQS